MELPLEAVDYLVIAGIIVFVFLIATGWWRRKEEDV